MCACVGGLFTGANKKLFTTKGNLVNLYLLYLVYSSLLYAMAMWTKLSKGLNQQHNLLRTYELHFVTKSFSQLCLVRRVSLDIVDYHIVSPLGVASYREVLACNIATSKPKS